MKVLNLYAGLGGNRKNWVDVDVTALELYPEIANVYKHYFPNDLMLLEPSHEYLLEHFKEFDFIWSSPPCPSHSRMRYNISYRFRGSKAVYPDMRLYEEILFLKYYFKGKWVVENVIPYYEPLIKPMQILQRHCIWSNFDIPFKKFDLENIRAIQIPELQKLYGFDLSNFKISNKRQVLRNCVTPDLGQYILGCMLESGRE